MFRRIALVSVCAVATLAAARPAAAFPPRSPGAADTLEVATFAGGCFWCVEEAFEGVEGVKTAVSGYTGGTLTNPSYEDVSAGGSGHYESVNVFFDPGVVSYAQILQTFWHNVDPTDDDGQFCDRGPQYRSAIFVRDARQREVAEASKRALEAARSFPILTEILPATTFWPAEEYHQDFYRKSSVRYRFYKFNCGRKARLEEVWGADAGH